MISRGIEQTASLVIGMKFQELQNVLEELKEDKRKKIVEGERDKKALEKFQVKKIRTINSTPLREITSGTKEKEVIILTDYDKTGKKLSKNLIRLYRAEGIKTDLDYKRRLGKLKGISEIEEIPSKYEELKKRGGKNG